MRLSAESVWIILMVLSVGLLAWRYLPIDSTTFSILLMLVTLIKGQLVVDYFMGLKSTIWYFRWIPTLWLVVVLSLVLASVLVPIS